MLFYIILKKNAFLKQAAGIALGEFEAGVHAQGMWKTGPCP
jgi:hypothetical protein